MRYKVFFIWIIVGTVFLNMSFVMAIKSFPQIVYGYAHHCRFNIQYPSLTEEESKTRGCFISRYMDETGQIGFLEYQQNYRKEEKKNVNTDHCLYFILDCRGRSSGGTRKVPEGARAPLSPIRGLRRLPLPLPPL